MTNVSRFTRIVAYVNRVNEAAALMRARSESLATTQIANNNDPFNASVLAALKALSDSAQAYSDALVDLYEKTKSETEVVTHGTTWTGSSPSN